MKKILIPIAVLGVIAYLTKDKWMLPFIDIKLSSDGKSYEYKLFANGNTVKGVAPINPSEEQSSSIKKIIGINEFKIYPPFVGQIRAFIYEDGKDDEIASSVYDIKTKTASIYYEKSYGRDTLKTLAKYTPYISAAALVYMGLRLNHDNLKKHAAVVNNA